MKISMPEDKNIPYGKIMTIQITFMKAFGDMILFLLFSSPMVCTDRNPQQYPSNIRKL